MRSHDILARVSTVLALTAIAMACGSDSEPTELGDDDLTGDTRSFVTVQGIDRTFTLHVPPSLDTSVPAPLLIALHGASQTGEELKASTGLDAVADESGLIVVYPDGVQTSWALGCNCTDADFLGIDDHLFVEILLDALDARLTLDMGRVYVAGISLGGQFAQVLGCTMTDRVAAAASVAASTSIFRAARCTPSAPVSILFILGTEDPIFLWDGITDQLLSGPATVDFWRDLNGCSDQVVTGNVPDISADGTTARTESYRVCDGTAEVQLYAVEGGGHSWPGSLVPAAPALGLTSQDFSASEVIVEFLLDQHRN